MHQYNRSQYQWDEQQSDISWSDTQNEASTASQFGRMTEWANHLGGGPMDLKLVMVTGIVITHH